ncbi:hypothetical protein KBC75_01080 [Candidatus Shapirobacteria bacterium]|nr:hypothetical protein [Candidatus Shapirobacteria bacterium]
MFKHITKFAVALSLILILGVFLYPSSLKSSPPTQVKDTLSNSQLSFFGRLAPGANTGDSTIRISLTSGTAPSITTNNLFVGDTIAIGTTGSSSGPVTLFTIKDIGSTADIQLNTGIGQSNAFTGAAVIATRSAIHTISLTPQSNSTGGFWQFLIKASTGAGETYNDGIPDQQGFDLGQDVGATTTGSGTRLKVSDITCPNWGIGTTTAYSIGTTVVGSNTYHLITCALGVGGTNQIGVGYSATIGRNLASGSQLINPAPSTGHTEGSADVYTFYVRHLDNTSTLISADSLQGKIAVIEAVRVTADIDPTLTFTISNSNVGVGGTPCGLAGFGANAANTTADSLAYGSIPLGVPNDLAQQLTCVTNATSGYVVTVYEDGPMHNIGNGTTLRDTDCNGIGCTPSSATAWSSYSTSGFGYTLQNVNVGQTATTYPLYRPFGNGRLNAQTIMQNSSTPTANEQAYICYRLVASTTQEAGSYESKLVYTATASF